jgi:hypothetical protein
VIPADLYTASFATRSRMNLCFDYPDTPLYFPGPLHAFLGTVGQTAFRDSDAVFRQYVLGLILVNIQRVTLSE